MQDVIAATDGGSLLRIQLSPGADDDAFPTGYNPWRDCIEARVEAQAQQGEANQALIELVADHFAIPTAQVQIKNGHTSRRKTLMLHGVPLGKVEESLKEVLPD